MRFVQLLTKAPSLTLHQRLMTTTTRYAKPAARTFTRKPTAIKKADDATPPRQNESFGASKGAAAVSDNDQHPDPSNETAQYFPAIDQFDTPTDDLLVTDDSSHNWSTSFFGLSTEPFSSEVSTVLQQELNPDDVEIKPDGLLYLPEIKYRRILNKAFGPGGWGLAPRGDHSISNKNISREYALICHGRFVSQARGEQDFFDTAGLPTASEGCKSNALMRCCKDLGIASELWDPVFIKKFKRKHCVEVWTEHVTTKRKKKLWRKKDDVLEYPYKENNIA